MTVYLKPKNGTVFPQTETNVAKVYFTENHIHMVQDNDSWLTIATAVRKADYDIEKIEA